jgi:hypothetical protein
MAEDEYVFNGGRKEDGGREQRGKNQVLGRVAVTRSAQSCISSAFVA